MEGRMKKYGQLSPGRAKVWTQKSPVYLYNSPQQQQRPQQQQYNAKVPLVYYLSSNRQLEHPHFMEVPVSSPEGLRLRDVIERLNVVRGRGMAAKYSWSCKRSYKTGYVWHDLCEEDLILPANGNEYLLKGSELFDESSSGGCSAAENTAVQQNMKPRAEPRIHDESSSSSNLNARIRKGSQPHYLSPPHHRSCSSPASPDSFISLKNPSLRFANASTQTDLEAFPVVEDKQTFIKDCPLMETCTEKQVFEMKGNISRGFVSPPLSTSSDSFPSYQANTLESLIRADIMKLKTIKRCLETEGPRVRPSMKLKPANLIMQLISCGSIYVKDHNLDMVPSYNHSFSRSMFSSPALSSSFMNRELDSQSQNPHVTSMKYESKEYFTGSLSQTKILNDDPSPSSSHGER